MYCLLNLVTSAFSFLHGIRGEILSAPCCLASLITLKCGILHVTSAKTDCVVSSQQREGHSDYFSSSVKDGRQLCCGTKLCS